MIFLQIVNRLVFANQKHKLHLTAQKQKRGNNFTFCVGLYSICGGLLWRKVCGNHACLCDLLKLQQAQLHTAIKLRDKIVRKKSQVWHGSKAAPKLCNSSWETGGLIQDMCSKPATENARPPDFSRRGSTMLIVVDLLAGVFSCTVLRTPDTAAMQSGPSRLSSQTESDSSSEASKTYRRCKKRFRPKCLGV